MLPSESVSTLPEIEGAADALPLEQKKKLLDFLAARLNGGQGKDDLTNLEEFAGTLRVREDPLACAIHDR